MQKTLLAQYMVDYSEMARNIIPKSGQGKAKLLQLWENLANKLNSEGPPTKSVKLWRKVHKV